MMAGFGRSCCAPGQWNSSNAPLPQDYCKGYAVRRQHAALTRVKITAPVWMRLPEDEKDELPDGVALRPLRFVGWNT
jgi:hypothetical protein